ncbi:BTB/POZ domain-containing protein 3 [Ceratitis capitata]|uniref:(Mediterranean fruit fly) hypothetical protein n=1 Tax=Ceratitis capitata TaxID=7213 RepID=A0A811TZF7_CERCA|nr:BTB/POZ domain-containing protein 3 [Ceratitis capitata]CAD6991528.1 unnamed protein product [Ceratitis capitata]
MFCKRMPSSKERRMRLLQDDHLSDCQFLVGDPACEEPRLFHCHKMILATASEVFERMFYSEFDIVGPIRITEVGPKSFEHFLRYVYIYEIESEQLLPSTSTISELFYLADKYMMQDLIDEIVEYLKCKHNWTSDDVWLIFDLACLHENLPLILLCYEKLLKNTILLLINDGFYQLNVNHLKRLVIFLSKQPQISTNLIFKYLEEYGRRNALHKNRKSEKFHKLVDAACHLDFNKLSIIDLESGPGASYIFNNQ